MARLIETSLWIDFTRSRTPVARKTEIRRWILDPDAALCEPVAFEVLRHATVKERPLIEAQFASLPLLPTPATLWRDAARLGQACRDQGFTAGSVDLLIAALALHHHAELITSDQDFRAIAKASKLQVTLLSKPAMDG
ncbi:MAG: PIN domain-containing protein [Kiritimatiellia bacterium]